jgi:uncharacterized protein
VNPDIETAYIAFEGDRCIGSGSPRAVLRAAKEKLDQHPKDSVLVFDRATSAVVDIDYRGSVEEMLARLAAINAIDIAADDAPQPAPRGPGRPKLGVVAREITLLPRHWEWLAQQSGGASVALRRLVDEARRTNKDKDRIRTAQEAAYRFMAAIAGNKPQYDEAARALFAGDGVKFEALIRTWPKDVRDHICRLAEAAFAQETVSKKHGS